MTVQLRFWIAVLGLGLVGCEVRPSPQPRVFQNLSSEGLIIAEGRWNTSDRYTAQVPRSNAVRIECKRANGSCTEFLAQLITRRDDNHFNSPMLSTLVTTYDILEWTEARVVARAEPRAFDLELRIALADGVIERTARETSARGAIVTNLPPARLWTLR